MESGGWAMEFAGKVDGSYREGGEGRALQELSVERGY